MNQPGTTREWHILGCGAMGLLWANLLQRIGHKVTLIVKPERLPGLSAGVELVDFDHGAHTHKFQAVIGSSVVKNDRAKLLVTTKAYDTIEALSSVACLPMYQSLLILQNGMGISDNIKRLFPNLSFFDGVTSQGAYRTRTNTVVHAGTGPTYFGRQGAHDKPFDDLDHVSMSVHFVTDIQYRMWVKLGINCVINGLSVINDCTNGEILQPKLATQVSILSAEIIEVMQQELGVPIHDLDLEGEIKRVANATRDNICSMRQDVLKRRTTELDFINGYLCERASKHNIAVPANRALLEQLREATRTSYQT